MALIRRVRTIRKNRIGRRRLLEQQAHDPLARGVRASIVARGLDGLEELFYLVVRVLPSISHDQMLGKL
jgi:hypothetical protein